MMSKEIKHDRCDFLGLGVNEHCLFMIAVS